MSLKGIAQISVVLVYSFALMADIKVLDPHGIAAQESKWVHTGKFKGEKYYSILYNGAEVFTVLERYLNGWNQLLEEAKQTDGKIVYSHLRSNDIADPADFAAFSVKDFVVFEPRNLTLSTEKPLLKKKQYKARIDIEGQGCDDDIVEYKITKAFYYHLRDTKLAAKSKKRVIGVDKKVFELDRKKLKKPNIAVNYEIYVKLLSRTKN